jgi:hypothetical protein
MKKIGLVLILMFVSCGCINNRYVIYDDSYMDNNGIIEVIDTKISGVYDMTIED